MRGGIGGLVGVSIPYWLGSKLRVTKGYPRCCCLCGFNPLLVGV